MIKNEKYLFDPQFLFDIAPVTEKLLSIFRSDMGVRIGQSTVCSQKMHSFHPESPEKINILQDLDAGQAFYQRTETGSIYHLDIFHQCGQVDHIQVAIKVQQVIEVYNRHYVLGKRELGDKNDIVKADFVDVQTSTGGGRITGELSFGKKLSLRKAHSNHVHLTVMIPPVHLACLIYIIMAVENSILSCNLELRCNEKINNIKGVSKQKSDLMAYIDESDSLLQRKNHKLTFEPNQRNQDVNEHISNSDEAVELKEFNGKREAKTAGDKPTGSVNSCRATETFLQESIIKLTDNSINVDEYGKKFKGCLEEQLPEIEAHLRKVARKAKCLYRQSGKSKILENNISWPLGGGKPYEGKREKQYGELAIAEMINAAARRMVEDGDKVFKILHDDIRYFTRKKRRKSEFCVLIDASSSMEGQRIQVAKLLAKYLFFSTSDRISVIVFQQNQAWIQVPFTHDFRQLEQSLEGIKAYGETPLALGLTACLQYIEQEKARNPIIILITDGVPTLGTVTSNPVSDALQVAQKIKDNNYGFTCIGLKPHLGYLNQLSEVAGGSIYAVENLSKTVGIK
jgi:magnesium chelatase subunit D